MCSKIIHDSEILFVIPKVLEPCQLPLHLSHRPQTSDVAVGLTQEHLCKYACVCVHTCVYVCVCVCVCSGAADPEGPGVR